VRTVLVKAERTVSDQTQRGVLLRPVDRRHQPFGQAGVDLIKRFFFVVNDGGVK